MFEVYIEKLNKHSEFITSTVRIYLPDESDIEKHKVFTNELEAEIAGEAFRIQLDYDSYSVEEV